MPSGLVGGAIAQVFLQRAAEANNRTNDLPKVTEDVFKRLISLGIFTFLLMTLIGRDAFIIIFGAHWAEAGVHMQILSLSILFSFIDSPISTLFAILEKQGSGLIFNIVFFTTRTIAMVVDGLMGNARIALALFAATGIVSYSWLCFWLLSYAGVPLNRPLYYLDKYTAYCLPILGLTALAKWNIGINPLGILIISCLGAIAYYAIILKQDKELQKPVQILFQRFRFLKTYNLTDVRR